MISRALCVLLLVFTQSACSTWHFGIDSAPLKLPLEDTPFHANSEVLAKLAFSTAQGDGQYLLALGTTEADVALAVLSPQGLPVASIDYHSGHWLVSRTGVSKQQLQAQMLLVYLGLIYFDDAALAVQLAEGWHVTSVAGERLFTRTDTGEHSGAEVRILYQGDGPWYQAVRLSDTKRGIQLGINILEYKHVLSE